MSQRGPGLTQEQKNRCVTYHNKLRKGEGASNMESLVSTRAVVSIRGLLQQNIVVVRFSRI